MKKKIILIIILALFLMSGCETKLPEAKLEIEEITEDYKSIEFKDVSYDKTNTIRIPVYNLNYINPFFPNDKSEVGIYSLLYENLFSYEENKIKPILAKSYSINSEENKIDVFLKEGIEWKDGEALNADDVIFTYKSILNADDEMPYKKWISSIFYDDYKNSSIAKNIKIKKIDDYHIEFGLSELPRKVENMFIMPIMPEHVFKELDLAKDKEKMVDKDKLYGTGPYYISNIIKLKKIEMLKNPNYRMKDNQVEKIEAIIVKDYSANIALFKSELTDLAFYYESNWQHLVEDKKINVIPYGGERFLMMGFNPESNIFKKGDISLKKAIYSIIDREELVKENFSEKAIVGNFPEVMNQEYNVNLNKWALKIYFSDYMKESGYQYNVIENKWVNNNSTCKVKIAYNIYWEQDYKCALSIKSKLEENGIEVELLKYDEYIKDALDKECDIVLFSYDPGINTDDINLFRLKNLEVENKNLDLILDKVKLKENNELNSIIEMYGMYLNNPSVLPILKTEEVVLVNQRINIIKNNKTYNAYDLLKSIEIIN